MNVLACQEVFAFTKRKSECTINKMPNCEGMEAYDGIGSRCGIQPLVDNNRVTGWAVDSSRLSDE